ncbi:MAG: hypothetical protein ACREHD_09560 [Pirellulales bacterium]
MNGHSTAEILAFTLLEAQRELGGEICVSRDRPIFIFTAGWETGARELKQRLGRAASIALGQSVDAPLLDAFARQLLHFASEDKRRTPCDGPGSAAQENTGRVHLRSIAEAQAKFLRALAVRESGECDKWGMELVGVPGDYALYLRLLFPRARVVFLHRDPLEALVEILYAGMGFTLVRREVYLAIQHRFELPTCSPTTPRRSIPFFMPMLEHWGGEMSYLAEDYAFSRRARLCGYKIMADTSIRLWHIGMYRYGYEDAGNEVERVPTYRHVFESRDRRGG